MRVRSPPPALSDHRAMFSEMKTHERAEARRLRREEGRSVKEIERLLGVARSTASRWVRDIPLTSAQRSALKQRNPIYNGQFAGAATNAERGRARRLAYQERGRLRARRADSLYVAACMLYWAEGDKGRNAVRLANSDPGVIRHFAEFLRVEFGVTDEQFRVTCNLFADHETRKTEIEDFWLATLGLRRACLCKSIVNRYSKYSEKKRKNKLPYGTCRISVHSTEIVQTIYGSIQEFVGFDRADWLDGA
jgi:transposase-like protein